MPKNWESREKKLDKRKNRMPVHGRNIGTVYSNAWAKRDAAKNGQVVRPGEAEKMAKAA